jgi:hypothetical protein
MDQHPRDLDHGDAIHDRIGCVAMLSVALEQAAGQNAGAGGQDSGAVCFARPIPVHVRHLDPSPEYAWPGPGQKRHGFRGFNKQRRVERTRGNVVRQAHGVRGFQQVCGPDIGG